jgi:hypothetical protein
MEDLTKQEVLAQSLTDYRNSLPSVFVNYNKITEEDLKQLKTVKKQKIVLTQPFAQFKVGDILEVKFISNTQQSEPPSFLVIDEKLGSTKYGFGGRGSTPFYELYKEKAKANIVSSNGNLIVEKKIVYNVLITAVVLSVSYYIYRKYKK